MNRKNPSPASTAAIWIWRLSNQSSVWPRSSISWKQATPRASTVKPSQSKRRLDCGFDRGSRISSPTMASTAKGGLTTNTSRQW